MEYYYLYKITNLVNGKIYIGVHKTTNLDDGYMGSGKNLQKAISKYGIENFQKEILKWFDNEDEMFQEEAEIVNNDFIYNEGTYNIGYGGRGGWKYCNEKGLNLYTRNGIIWNGYNNLDNLNGTDYLRYIKENYPEEWEKYKQKVSQGVKKHFERNGSHWEGRTHTEETKRKIAEKNSKHQQGSNNNQYGTCWIFHPHLKKNKKINKSDLDYWLDKGWQKGRKMKW